MPRNKESLIWKAYIIDQAGRHDTDAEASLSLILQDLENGGWIPHTIIPNGVNRWTVVAFKKQEDE